MRWFQFTRPRGARPSLANPIAKRRLFQFTRPRGARLSPKPTHAKSPTFQFTRPRGARPRMRVERMKVGGFNSRAHGGRDLERLDRDRFRDPRFDSRAQGGRDWQDLRIFQQFSKFQFTRPRGARRALPSGAPNLCGVSIHAPTGGATRIYLSLSRDCAFQFTRPRGARPVKNTASPLQ